MSDDAQAGDDYLDSCDLTYAVPTPDEDVDGVVLFAGVKPGPLRPLRVLRKKRQWKRLFGV